MPRAGAANDAEISITQVPLFLAGGEGDREFARHHPTSDESTAGGFGLIATFVGIVASGILMVGWLFNAVRVTRDLPPSPMRLIARCR